MKYFIRVLLIFVCGISVSSVCVASEELFLRANLLYEENDYAHALEMYDKITNKGSAVWYNMGNCAYYIGDTVHALVYWERAKQGAPYALYNDSCKNIAYANSEHVERAANIFINFMYYISAISLFVLQIFFLVMLTITLMLTIQRWHKKYYWIIILCMLLTVTSGCLIGIKYAVCSYSNGIVIADHASLYAGPDDHYHVISLVDKREYVRIYNDKNGWYKIGHNNNIGWIAHNAVELV